MKKIIVSYTNIADNNNDFIFREIIESSKKALNLLQKEYPALKPTLSVVQVKETNTQTPATVIDEIIKLNKDPKIHGLLLRLANKPYTSNIINAMKPEKDVNG
ncbi:hypothetical protein JD844_024643 [Phrynosoma platyrhinos]|uniref:Uncharacterized protein n=1 Tax=Phrynosoma platyrhinos TaxID=52577 RepID=A0ABQ7SYK3_PHRPL|nr:hypothetical protein JD844_024643 [Phrynosoma platyrhinos]